MEIQWKMYSQRIVANISVQFGECEKYRKRRKREENERRSERNTFTYAWYWRSVDRSFAFFFVFFCSVLAHSLSHRFAFLFSFCLPFWLFTFKEIYQWNFENIFYSRAQYNFSVSLSSKLFINRFTQHNCVYKLSYHSISLSRFVATEANVCRFTVRGE